MGRGVDALDGNCCAWVHRNALLNHGVVDKVNGGDICGKFVSQDSSIKEVNFDAMRVTCCNAEETDSYGDCDSASWPKGEFFVQVLKFAADEDLWLLKFT